MLWEMYIVIDVVDGVLSVIYRFMMVWLNMLMVKVRYGCLIGL